MKSFSRQEAVAMLELLLTGPFLRTTKSLCVVPVTSLISSLVNALLIRWCLVWFKETVGTGCECVCIYTQPCSVFANGQAVKYDKSGISKGYFNKMWARVRREGSGKVTDTWFFCKIPMCCRSFFYWSHSVPNSLLHWRQWQSQFFEQAGTQWFLLSSSLSIFCYVSVWSTWSTQLKDTPFFTSVISKYICLCKGMWIFLHGDDCFSIKTLLTE